MSNTKATGVAYLDPEFTTCYATEELGYSDGASSAVTQSTNKATAVTVNTSAGQITMNNASLNAATNVQFTLNCSLLGAKDVIIINHASGGTIGAYNVWASAGAGSCTVTVRNITGGALAEAIVLNFAIIHVQ